MSSCDVHFDDAARARGLDVRVELASDAAFLRDLFVACSPLSGLLPPAMLVQQADLQQAAHRAQRPGAMRRILLAGGELIGRIVVDWDDAAGSHCVDVAVLPERRGGGVGRALIGAWLDVAHARGMAARLQVLRDSPAVRTYRALGFVAVDDGEGAHATMVREPR